MKTLNKIIALLLLSIGCFSLHSESFGQIIAEKNIVDIGNVASNQRFYQIELQNASSETIENISQINGEVSIKVAESISLLPGQSYIIRIPLRYTEKRSFDQLITLQLNDETDLITFKIKGTVAKQKQNKQDCPDFSKRKRSKSAFKKNSQQQDVTLGNYSSALKLIDANSLNRDPLSNKHYRLNNLIFLIDASSSMQDINKQAILDAAIEGLSDILRPSDQITIISYSGSTKMVFPTATNVLAADLISAIQDLKNQGLTNGSLGIKSAYMVADSIFMNGANNEIILATDGAFNANESEEITSDIISKYGQSGIRLSILGINNKGFAAKEMRALCAAGYGSYINVTSAYSAKNALKKAVKNHSRK